MVSFKVPKSAGYSKNNDNKLEKIDFFTGSIINGQLIGGYSTSTNNTTIVYQVPYGYTLFITSLGCYGGNTGVTNTLGYIYINNTNFSLLRVIMLASNIINQNFTYGFPIKVNSGEIIYNYTNSVTFTGYFTGYLVPNSLIPNFI